MVGNQVSCYQETVVFGLAPIWRGVLISFTVPDPDVQVTDQPDETYAQRTARGLATEEEQAVLDRINSESPD